MNAEGDGGLRQIGEGMGEGITTEAPVSTTQSWINAGFLESISGATNDAAMEEESGLVADGLEEGSGYTYNQQQMR